MNSPLISLTKLSPHRWKRTHEVDTVTIHCVVGQFLVENLVHIFDQERVVSCNYCIAKDGKIGLVVPEDERSACTSSVSNDNRAITIEVSSDISHPYEVTPEAYKALVALLTDICQRHPKIGKLRWMGNSALIGQVDKQNITVHRWFANKSCPGDYLYKLHHQIVQEVNQRLEGGAQPNSIMYTIQVGAFKNRDYAINYLQELQSKGFKGFIKEVAT